VSKQDPLLILGAGSWGSAIAIHLARSGQPVILWGHDKAHVNTLKNERENKAYLPNQPFPEKLTLEHDLDIALSKTDNILIAVPSHAFKVTIARLPPKLTAVAWLTKGLEPIDNSLLSDVVFNRFPHAEVAIISGPSFAREVASNLPTAITLASNSKKYAEKLHRIFHVPPFRVYFSDDIIGVQVAGAIKNVLAIAVGISDGLGFGANARAALITRGLSEMAKLGVAMGALEKTFMGLTGLGDLLLTATDNQSRNRRFGLLIGKGYTLDDAQKEIKQVVEGRFNAKQVIHLAKHHQLTLPISNTVNDILNKTLKASEAVDALLSRPPAYE
jgi:glycerol-3-phosphate dehydrogenase (NAD(P)+)